MKKIKIEETTIQEKYIKQQADPDKTVNYIGLIEYALDLAPQGGFKPSDIRERNRIQTSLDKVTKENMVSFEDADFTALKKIVATSRWNIRSKDLAIFLNLFED